MPFYRARGVEARLFATDLDKPVVKRYGVKGTRSSDRIGDSSLGTTEDAVLREVPIIIEPGKGSLYFLEDDERNFSPFNLVIVGPSVQDLSEHLVPSRGESRHSGAHGDDVEELSPLKTQTSPGRHEEGHAAALGIESGTKEGGLYDNSQAPSSPKGVKSMPKALILRVEIAKEKFLKNRFEKKQKLDMKIDVFFNGDLCGSTYISVRNLARVPATHYYGGYRIAEESECPWILKMPVVVTDCSSRQSNRQDRELQERWANVNQSLSQTAETQRHSSGEYSTLGVYLKALSRLNLPEDAQTHLKSSSMFGVVDLVVTAGNGRMDGNWSSVIDHPMAIRTDTDYIPPELTTDDKNKLKREVKSLKRSRPISASGSRPKRIKLDTPLSHQFEEHTPQRPLSTSGQSPNRPQPALRKQVHFAEETASEYEEEQSVTAASGQLVPQRGPSLSQADEEITMDDVFPNILSDEDRFRNLSESTNLTTTTMTPSQPSGNRTPYVSPWTPGPPAATSPAFPDSQPSAASPSGPASRLPQSQHDFSQPAIFTPTPEDYIPYSDSTGPANPTSVHVSTGNLRRRTQNLPPPAASFLAPARQHVTQPSQSAGGSAGERVPAWQMPALSAGSVATYAVDRERKVRAERSGWFEEEQIICGMRFLVG